ncbi:unnamed protein product [Prunus armeniaca]|uniref:Endonuclease/exonuclease/phosphatase domain-containing protein n=1 Tax=Prunus armeniaca TaxID=36596 RepID=A0A6J5XPS1_PRUAR|nr:hypothetical protein GBA52_020418 [Prunus armeniaca]CAB4283634.1 unnamed protein product [Prunus armeniaca]CAB4313945.1 unnamed protein product [Prunus armeniaca]
MKGVQRQLGMMRCWQRRIVSGLALLWQQGVEVIVLSSSRGHIDVILHGVEMETFRFIGFCGNPNMRLRRHSWDLLHRIGGSIHGPQLVGGDFN